MAVFAAIVQFATAAAADETSQQISQCRPPLEAINHLVWMRREHKPTVDQFHQQLARDGRLTAQESAPILQAAPEIFSQPSGAEGCPCRCRLRRVEGSKLVREMHAPRFALLQGSGDRGNRPNRQDRLRVTL